MDDENNNTSEWTVVPRLAIGPGPDPYMNVRLDWVFDGFTKDVTHYYLNGYKAAIDQVYEAVCERRVVIEVAFFPLAFLWRHRLELVLKEALRSARSLWCEPHAADLGHNLDKLWRTLRPYAEHLGASGEPNFSNVEATLQEFQKVDPGADGFRYPNLRSGDSSLGEAPRAIDIVNFHNSMAGCANFIDGLWGEFSHREDFFLQEEPVGMSNEQRRAARINYMGTRSADRERTKND